MPFKELPKQSKYSNKMIKPGDIELTTQSSRNIITLRFGKSAASALGVEPGKAYKALWGYGSDEGLIQLHSTLKADSTAWPVVVRKDSGVAQITLTHLPTTYRGKRFKRQVISGEFIAPVSAGKSGYIKLRLPKEFFDNPL